MHLRNLVAAVVVVVVVHAAPAPGGTFRGIGGERARDVSADGSTVVGFDGPQFFEPTRGWRWTQRDGLTFLPDLTPDADRQRAHGVSADGSVVVGISVPGGGDGSAFRWTASGGMTSLGSGRADAVSGDGLVAVGVVGEPSQAVRWIVNPVDGGVIRERLSPTTEFSSTGSVNHDGSLVVGYARYPGQQTPEAFRWTRSEGLVQLGRLAGHRSSFASDLSVDGSVLVGTSEGPDPSEFEAIRWTAAGGMVGLGDFPGGLSRSFAMGVTADGSRVVGYGNTEQGPQYFIWDAARGMRDLRDVLVNEWGVDLGGWTLTAPTNPGGTFADPIAISADGNTIVGTGLNPQGRREAWIAVVPEPGGGLLVLAGAAWTLSRRLRSRAATSRRPGRAGASTSPAGMTSGPAGTLQQLRQRLTPLPVAAAPAAGDGRPVSGGEGQ